MQPVTRWKLVCAALAVTGAFEFFADDNDDPVKPIASRSRSADVSGAYRAPVAASRSDIEALVRKLKAARSIGEVRALAQQLGAIGDDKAIDEVRHMIGDRRPMVPIVIVQAIGSIGTNHAVDVLVELTQDRGLRDTAIDALGTTHNAKAEPVLANIAKTGHLTAITALGELGTDGSVEVLLEIASMRTTGGKYAIMALGESSSPQAAPALRKLIDSPSIEIAAAAIQAIQQVDDELFAKLVAIVQSGEAALVDPALAALVHAGDRAYEPLREIALHGPRGMRGSAVTALAQLRTDDAMSTIATILESGDLETARSAVQALWEIETDAARELVISSALSDRRNFTGALDMLMRMSGPDVEQALLTIAKSDRDHRFEVLGHLMTAGSDDALGMVKELVLRGNDAERMQALSVLGEGSTPASAQALIDLARTQSGQTQVEAIKLLARHAGSPEVARVLRDRLENGKPEEAAAAASALATAGTVEARDALIAALSNGDDDLTRMALDSLASFRLTEDMSNALVNAAKANPDLMPEVMRRLVTENSRHGFELARTALASGNFDAAQEALYSLERSATPAAIQLIEGTLSSRDAAVRSRAIDALGRMHATGAEETVIGALRDGDADVRAAAVRALGDLGTDRARATLLDLTRTGTPEDKQAVISSLQYAEDPSVGQALGGMIHDANAQVAISAIDAVLARGVNIDNELAAIAGNASKPREVRMRAALVLQTAGILDPRVIEDLQNDNEDLLWVPENASPDSE